MQLGNVSNAANVSFTADFNQAEHGGVTAADRQAAMAAAAAAAAQAAGGLLPTSGNSSNATELPPVAVAPGLFDPLTVDEMLAGEGGALSWHCSNVALQGRLTVYVIIWHLQLHTAAPLVIDSLQLQRCSQLLVDDQPNTQHQTPSTQHSAQVHHDVKVAPCCTACRDCTAPLHILAYSISAWL
jgi:hypothetical protein